MKIKIDGKDYEWGSLTKDEQALVSAIKHLEDDIKNKANLVASLTLAENKLTQKLKTLIIKHKAGL